MRARALAALGALLLPAAALAHVGSPHIYLEDEAGPWPVVVACEMPPAVPGEAVVQVRLSDRKPGEPVRVRVREVPPAGDDRAPEWRAASPSAHDPDFFTAPLPLMVYGLWHAEIEVSGARGEGTIRFPISARVPAPRAMDTVLAVTLVGLALLLVASLASILAGLGREGSARDDAATTPAARRRGVRWAVVGCTIFLSFTGFIGYLWGGFHKSRLVRTGPSLSGQVAVDAPLRAGSTSRVTMTVLDARGELVRDVAPDHDKMMHLVVVELPGAGVFMHLHPSLARDGVFSFALTPPRPGRYAWFADVLRSSGEGDTATGTLDVAPGANRDDVPLEDPDDSVVLGPPQGGARDLATAPAGGGTTVVWLPPGPSELRALEVQKLLFELRDEAGRPVASLDPYMGMAGHLLILRDDGSMFAHVHPTGTVAGRMGAMPKGHLAMMTEPIAGARASFPYAFPRPGRYRLWVQMKHAGAIRTGIFDVDVK